jgi:hypothetical protein
MNILSASPEPTGVYNGVVVMNLTLRVRGDLLCKESKIYLS